MSVAVESYKHFSAIALGLFWFTTVVMILLLKGEKSKSISAHAASVKKSALAFGVVAALSTMLWIIFFIKWFTPTFQLGALFNIVVLTMLLLYGIAGVVPDTKGMRHTVHVYAAVMASVLLLPAMVMLCMNNFIGSSARVFIILALLTMGFLGYILARNRKHKRLLMYETAYFLCFDVSILVVTYIR